MLTCNSLSPATFLRRVLALPGRSRDALEGQLTRSVAESVGPAWQVMWFDAGRSALSALLAAYRIGHGDEVILPAYTCVVVPNQVAGCGARTVFVDVDAATLGYDWMLVERAITPATRAIIVPHNFGRPCRVPDDLRSRYPAIRFIDDAAHGLGTLVEGQWLGTRHDGAFFSFEYSKNLTGGIGGLALLPAGGGLPDVKTGHVPVVDQLRLAVTLCGHLLATRSALAGRIWMALARRCKLVYRSGDDQVHGGVAHLPRHLARLSATLLVPQLTAMAAIRAHKAVLARRYHQKLSALPGISLWEGDDSVHWVRFPFRIAGVAGNKADMARQLTAVSGLPVGVWFDDPIHPLGSFRHGYHAGQCPVGEQLAAEVFNLPMNCALQPGPALDAKLDRLCEALGKLL